MVSKHLARLERSGKALCVDGVWRLA